MSTTLAAPPARPRFSSAHRQAIAEVGLIFLVFFIQGAWPVPGVNETHYLTKAKHYWNPSWCPGDLFLDSRDAHQVFYWTCGWLTSLLSLTATAWIGRVATWLLLAWGWRRLNCALVPRPLFAVLSAALLVAGTSRVHLAGEWLIGGFEAKGLAYVLVFFALAAVAEGSWPAVWSLLGLASAFHVLVGGWSVLAAGVAWIAAGANRPPLKQTMGWLIVGLILALPGLAAAIHLNWGADPATIGEANRIYVFTRLPHHLVPQNFPPLNALRHILLIGGWLVLCYWVPADRHVRPIRWFVGTTIVFSLIGCLIAWSTLGHDVQAASLLRYYWFRMADILVPLGVALEIIRGLSLLLAIRPQLAQWGLLVAMILAGLNLGGVVFERQYEMRPQADGRISNLTAWKEICDWAAANTPPDAIFLTPRDAQSFHWYAGRSEVVSYKDIPQDAGGIVEWWHRVGDVYRQPQTGPEADGFASLAELGRAKLEALARKYHASYVIAGLDPPVALERVGPANRNFVVYRLTGNPPADAASDGETSP